MFPRATRKGRPINLLGIDNWPLWLVLAVFAATAAVIAVAGSRMSKVADRLADLTGLGEAFFGAVLLGGSTSLPGIVTSVAAASDGYAELAVSNAIGGIAAQTVFLVFADMTYRKVNLEHAAASVENLLQGALLVGMLALALLAVAGPDMAWFGVNPFSVVLVLGYAFGLRLVRDTRENALWHARRTPQTRVDEPEAASAGGPGLARCWALFALLALIVAVAGYLVAQTGMALADRTGLSETVVGALLTAIATSLPELVTSIAAVRQGALTLAVGGIIGGNSFDVLFVAFSDMAYRDGSIYHAITSRQVFLIALSILLTAILLMGLIRREKRGIANIGFESFLLLVVYLGAVGLLFFM